MKAYSYLQNSLIKFPHLARLVIPDIFKGFVALEK
jgi:hypothetical protein